MRLPPTIFMHLSERVVQLAVERRSATIERPTFSTDKAAFESTGDVPVQLQRVARKGGQ